MAGRILGPIGNPSVSLSAVRDGARGDRMKTCPMMSKLGSLLVAASLLPSAIGITNALAQGRRGGGGDSGSSSGRSSSSGSRSSSSSSSGSSSSSSSSSSTSNSRSGERRGERRGGSDSSRGER